MHIDNSIAVAVPDILLPKEGTDLKKWAVIACDQYTSEPDYWQKIESEVGDAPSTLRIVLPEVYLPREDARYSVRAHLLGAESWPLGIQAFRGKDT